MGLHCFKSRKQNRYVPFVQKPPFRHKIVVLTSRGRVAEKENLPSEELRFSAGSAKTRSSIRKEITESCTHFCICRDATSNRVGLPIIEISVPKTIWRKSSLDWAGIVECKGKQSFFRSLVAMMALVNSQRLRIWYLGYSRSNTLREWKPVFNLGSVLWWFSLFSISIGSFFSDRVHRVLIKVKPVDTAWRVVWKVERGGKWIWESLCEFSNNQLF